MVLGVNDESQIANESLRRSDGNFSLIKRDINNLMQGNTKIKDLQGIIDKSNIICIFGMSLGATDKMWWQAVAAWLEHDQARKLLIFSWKMTSSEGIKEERATRQKVLKNFFDNGDISESIRMKIDQQICVVGTKGILDFTLIKNSAEAQEE